jgi:hypothetical protein
VSLFDGSFFCLDLVDEGVLRGLSLHALFLRRRYPGAQGLLRASRFCFGVSAQ